MTGLIYEVRYLSGSAIRPHDADVPRPLSYPPRQRPKCGRERGDGLKVMSSGIRPGTVDDVRSPNCSLGFVSGDAVLTLRLLDSLWQDLISKEGWHI
jgi:hypothetical protein